MAKELGENAKRNKTAMLKRKTKVTENQDDERIGGALMGGDNVDQPFLVRVLAVGVTSYLAHQVWTKRRMLTDAWYTKEQTEMEHLMVTLFEYMVSMGLIFLIGIVVGVVCRKGVMWAKRLTKTG
ncbi:unnamed protein product [Hyaloperonospora brassicae]|uniref:Uncharacterized protein n=1 Tax=Hyaloperonospora brassicae TaxID=162125 RepID=A0AAV0TFH0_HYABA|nr:unnamed protein product [Hyaloperonospora brassicae]